jgi:hypothetical protein
MVPLAGRTHRLADRVSQPTGRTIRVVLGLLYVPAECAGNLA